MTPNYIHHISQRQLEQEILKWVMPENVKTMLANQRADFLEKIINDCADLVRCPREQRLNIGAPYGPVAMLIKEVEALRDEVKNLRAGLASIYEENKEVQHLIGTDGDLTLGLIKALDDLDWVIAKASGNVRSPA